MPAVGKITMKRIGDDLVVSDESGQSYVIKGRGEHPTLEVDPRIDLTKPIYEQAIKLAAKDAAKKRKRSSAA